MPKSMLPPAKLSPQPDWEVHDALQTVKRAAEISADKVMMGKVRKLAATHAKTMGDIACKPKPAAKSPMKGKK